MTIPLPFITQQQDFPPVSSARDEPDGLLAMGGDLSPLRLLQAYRQGIFPWYEEGQPILWWSPKVRACIKPDQVHISRSMQKFIRKSEYRVTLNQAFRDVIEACSQRIDAPGTWITSDMKQAYTALHLLGHAHSIEVWDGDQLVGGLYGVAVGRVFCGESMFHRKTNASKLAFIRLCQHFYNQGGQLIDAQMPTPHLETLGVKAYSRQHFISQLEKYQGQQLPSHYWQTQELS